MQPPVCLIFWMPHRSPSSKSPTKKKKIPNSNLMITHNPKQTISTLWNATSFRCVAGWCKRLAKTLRGIDLRGARSRGEEGIEEVFFAHTKTKGVFLFKQIFKDDKKMTLTITYCDGQSSGEGLFFTNIPNGTGEVQGATDANGSWFRSTKLYLSPS